MSRKQLKVDAITNELAGASLFFQQQRSTPPPLAEQPAPPSTNETEASQPVTLYSSNEAKNVHSDGRTSERTDGQNPGRSVIRHAFDIYADQLFALQTLQLQAVQAGKKKPKLGSMVQQALDHYLREKNKKPTSV